MERYAAFSHVNRAARQCWHSFAKLLRTVTCLSYKNIPPTHPEEGAGWWPGLALPGPQSSVSSLPGQPSINPINPLPVGTFAHIGSLGRFIAVGGRRLAPAGRPPADAEQACGPMYI